MAEMIVGSVGFVLYLIYDWNSITHQNRFLQKFFLLGSLCVMFATIFCVVTHWGQVPLVPRIIGIVLAALFMMLLIYTLFFALPFDETYVKENQERLAYTKGVYAICRHPGVLWYAGLFLSLWGVTGNGKTGVFFIAMIAWNVIYVVYQDYYIFPRTFSNYQEYKQKTPFLIPNGKSIKECFRGR